MTSRLLKVLREKKKLTKSKQTNFTLILWVSLKLQSSWKLRPSMIRFKKPEDLLNSSPKFSRVKFKSRTRKRKITMNISKNSLRLMQIEGSTWNKLSKQPSNFRLREYHQVMWISLLHLLTPRNELTVKMIFQRMTHDLLSKHQLPC